MLSVVVGCHEACEEKELFQNYTRLFNISISYCTKIYAKWLGSHMLAFLGCIRSLASPVCTNLGNAKRMINHGED